MAQDMGMKDSAPARHGGLSRLERRQRRASKRSRAIGQARVERAGEVLTHVVHPDQTLSGVEHVNQGTLACVYQTWRQGHR